MIICRLSGFLLEIASAFAATPRAEMVPAQPRWGERVRLIYRSGSLAPSSPSSTSGSTDVMNSGVCRWQPRTRLGH